MTTLCFLLFTHFIYSPNFNYNVFLYVIWNLLQYLRYLCEILWLCSKINILCNHNICIYNNIYIVNTFHITNTIYTSTTNNINITYMFIHWVISEYEYICYHTNTHNCKLWQNSVPDFKECIKCVKCYWIW